MKRALILDTETTGLDASKDRCIEVACCLFDLERAAPVASYASLIRAESNAAEPINRIPHEMLAAAPYASDVWPRVGELGRATDVVIAHEASFDRGFVPAGFIPNATPWCCSKRHIEWPLAKTGEHLVHLALAHGVPVVGAHRAMTDVEILVRLLRRVHEMLESDADIHPLVRLIERAMRPRVKVAALVSYDDREKAKAAGFAWDAARKQWWREMPVEDVKGLPFLTAALP